MKRNFDVNLMLWIFVGVVGLFLGTANPLIHIPFAILLYPAALYKISRISTHPFRHGLITGMLASGAALYWISVAAHTYQKIPLPLALPLPLVVGFYLGIWTGAYTWILSKVKDSGIFRRCATAGILWYLMEWGLSFVLSGFPWLPLTAGFVPLTAFIQGASILGTYGLSGLFAFIACLVLEGFSVNFSWQRGNRARTVMLAYGGIMLLLCIFFLGYARLENAQGTKADSDEFLRVLMVQGNIPQGLKWTASIQQETLDKYFSLTQKAIQETKMQSIADGEANSGIGLIIWPETAIPFYYGHATALSKQINIFAEKINIPILFGSPAMEKTNGTNLYNRAYLLQNNTISQYDKEHLVPVGEYIPAMFRIAFLEDFLTGLGGFTPGTQTNPLILEDGKASLGVLICYEGIFPKLARERVADGAQLFINISNDAWYDYTSAAQQHLYLSSLRSVEQKRGMARGTNTGITAAVDSYGEILYPTELFVDAMVLANIYLEEDKTIFFHIAPYLPPLAMLGLLLLLYPFMAQQISGRSRK